MGIAKDITDKFWAHFEAGQLDAIEAYVAPDVHFKMPGVEASGFAPLKQMLAAYRAAFPDLVHHVKSHVESGDAIAIELDAVGTHTGPMQTPQGTIPATGKKVVWESCDYIRVKNGKIVSWHVYHDPTPFLTALGLLPAR